MSKSGTEKEERGDESPHSPPAKADPASRAKTESMPPPAMPPPEMISLASRMQPPPNPRQQSDQPEVAKQEHSDDNSSEGGAGAATAAPAAGTADSGGYEKPAWSGAPPADEFPYYFEVNSFPIGVSILKFL